MPIVNTRADLDALKGTPAYADTMNVLKASMTTRVDTATYPEGYGQPEYSGPSVSPNWAEVESLDTIERIGFTKAEFLEVYGEI